MAPCAGRFLGVLSLMWYVGMFLFQGHAVPLPSRGSTPCSQEEESAPLPSGESAPLLSEDGAEGVTPSEESAVSSSLHRSYDSQGMDSLPQLAGSDDPSLDPPSRESTGGTLRPSSNGRRRPLTLADLEDDVIVKSEPEIVSPQPRLRSLWACRDPASVSPRTSSVEVIDLTVEEDTSDRLFSGLNPNFRLLPRYLRDAHSLWMWVIRRLEPTAKKRVQSLTWEAFALTSAEHKRLKRMTVLERTCEISLMEAEILEGLRTVYRGASAQLPLTPLQIRYALAHQLPLRFRQGEDGSIWLEVVSGLIAPELKCEQGVFPDGSDPFLQMALADAESLRQVEFPTFRAREVDGVLVPIGGEEDGEELEEGEIRDGNPVAQGGGSVSLTPGERASLSARATSTTVGEERSSSHPVSSSGSPVSLEGSRQDTSAGEEGTPSHPVSSSETPVSLEGSRQIPQEDIPTSGDAGETETPSVGLVREIVDAALSRSDEEFIRSPGTHGGTRVSSKTALTQGVEESVEESLIGAAAPGSSEGGSPIEGRSALVASGLAPPLAEPTEGLGSSPLSGDMATVPPAGNRDDGVLDASLEAAILRTGRAVGEDLELRDAVGGARRRSRGRLHIRRVERVADDMRSTFRELLNEASPTSPIRDSSLTAETGPPPPWELEADARAARRARRDSRRVIQDLEGGSGESEPMPRDIEGDPAAPATSVVGEEPSSSSGSPDPLVGSAVSSTRGTVGEETQRLRSHTQPIGGTMHRRLREERDLAEDTQEGRQMAEAVSRASVVQFTSNRLRREATGFQRHYRVALDNLLRQEPIGRSARGEEEEPLSEPDEIDFMYDREIRRLERFRSRPAPKGRKVSRNCLRGDPTPRPEDSNVNVPIRRSWGVISTGMTSEWFPVRWVSSAN